MQSIQCIHYIQSFQFIQCLQSFQSIQFILSFSLFSLFSQVNLSICVLYWACFIVWWSVGKKLLYFRLLKRNGSYLPPDLVYYKHVSQGCMFDLISGRVSFLWILWNWVKPRYFALSSMVSHPSWLFNFTILVVCRVPATNDKERNLLMVSFYLIHSQYISYSSEP